MTYQKCIQVLNRFVAHIIFIVDLNDVLLIFANIKCNCLHPEVKILFIIFIGELMVNIND